MIKRDTNYSATLMVLRFGVLFFGMSTGWLYSQTFNGGSIYVAPEGIFSTLHEFENAETATFYNDGETFFYADYSNNGLVDYYQEEGRTYFIGNAIQRLEGEGESYFWDLLFDNRSSETPFELSADITAEGRVEFNNGIIRNDIHGGSFLFGNEAGHLGVSDKSHVDGPVMKLGNNSFDFPIGDQGYYRHAGISAPDAIAQTYKATYFLESAGTEFPFQRRPPVIELINEAEYWEIEPVGEQSELVLSLSWNTATTPAYLLEQPQALHIVRWDEAQQLWVDEGGVVDDFYQTVSAAVSKFGIFTLATVETEEMLPCQLRVYNAITPNNDGKNDYFFIDQLNNGGCTQNISVKIFNRWNVLVFETDNYGESGDLFYGVSQGRGTIGSDKLPAGTYFYLIEFDYKDSRGKPKVHQQQGYLYLNGN